MQYFAVIDSGTTNSRVYLLDNNRQLVAQREKKIGVRDAALSGTSETLRLGLKELIEETVFSVDLSTKDISFAITSGMITSEIGLVEISHLWAPVNIDDIASSIVEIRDPKILPLEIPFYFIRGIKNYFSESTIYKDIRKIDFMRGEETQIAGLLTIYQELKLPVIVIILSSHTKYIYLNQEKQIAGSLTTLSGQIFEALNKETSIGKSITSDGNQPPLDYFDRDVADIAYQAVQECGFLRALIMPRFMEVLLKRPWYEREFFINAAIAAEDLKVLDDFQIVGFSLPKPNFLIIGDKKRCHILEYLLNRCLNYKANIDILYEKSRIEQLNISGAITIAQKRGILI